MSLYSCLFHPARDFDGGHSAKAYTYLVKLNRPQRPGEPFVPVAYRPGSMRPECRIMAVGNPLGLPEDCTPREIEIDDAIVDAWPRFARMEEINTYHKQQCDAERREAEAGYLPSGEPALLAAAEIIEANRGIDNE